MRRDWVGIADWLNLPKNEWTEEILIGVRGGKRGRLGDGHAPRGVELSGRFRERVCPVAAAKVTPSYKAPAAAKKTTLAAPEKAKPAAALSPVESGFREMVAKEEGFSSWQGLQRLGDLDAKKRADKRVKMLLGAARVR